MKSLLAIVTTVCVGLLIGTEFSVSAFINPIMRKLEPREELRAIRLFAATLGTVMPFWYIASLALLVVGAALHYGEAGGSLLILASAIWAAVILLTVLFLVPINNRLARVDANADPGPALAEHNAWDTLHRWRVAALSVAMICFLLADRG